MEETRSVLLFYWKNWRLEYGTYEKKFSIYNQNVVGYVFIMPWLVGFLCFTLVPFLMSFVLSFTNFNILSPDTKFVGFDNYVKLFTQDKLFIKSLKVTFKFAFISVPLRLIFALLVANDLKPQEPVRCRFTGWSITCPPSSAARWQCP
ncbi:MAG: hypothetical protein V8S98_03055 [Lachnospiraceae bacterium]